MRARYRVGMTGAGRNSLTVGRAVALGALACAAVGGAARGAEEAGAGAEPEILPILNEQILLLATVVAAVAALPPLIEFLVDRRKRLERLALSLEVTPVSGLRPRLAGMDGLLAGIADLIDRARRPQAYTRVSLGNEILIIGPALSGKKSLAHRVAQEAGLERVITVYNPRNADALAKARSLALADEDRRVMLLLPRIDAAFEDADDEALSELDALVESVSERANVLVVGTAVRFVLGSELDNLFGTKIALPGAEVGGAQSPVRRDPALNRMLGEVARFYLARARDNGLVLEGMTEDECSARILERVSNPAEIEDIVAVCLTAAIHRASAEAHARVVATPELLDVAMGRVVPGAL